MSFTQQKTIISTRERALRSLAAQTGYRSIRALANASGIHRVTLWRILCGAKPRKATVAALATTIGVPTEVVRAALGGAE